MAAARARDLRLDFFRGLAMLIIFVAHVPGNSWTEYIPARFGFSSAAEMFVFCCGCASALAFGSIFVRRGWRTGTARILYRIWQLYWAHIGLFVVLATISAVATRLHIGTKDYAADLNLDAFGSDRWGAVTGMMTLSLVPDLLNILPMYVVLLALVPPAMALSTINPLLVVAASVALWHVVQATGLNLPAGGVTGRRWFFDPFAWQLMFFTGFAFGMGWFPKPRLNHPAFLPVAAAAVTLSVPVNFWAFTDNIPALLAVHDWLVPDGIVATTRLDVVRYAHFFCLAYVVLSLVDRCPKPFTSPALAPVVAIGRQSLPAFVSSVTVAWTAGIFLDVVGRDWLSTAAVNLLGFAAIFSIARSVAWLKSEPWSTRSERAASGRTGTLSRVWFWPAAPAAALRPDPSSRNDAEHMGGVAGRAGFSRRGAALLGLAAGLWPSAGDARDAQRCEADLPCLVQGGAYLVRPPAGWDGRSALPAIVFFHGWMQSAGDVMRDEAMARVMSDLGILLVAPEGAGHTWSFPGSPGHFRDEFAFIRAVVDDVELRFPVNKQRLWASGFSQGGSMVWYAACFLGDRFAAFVSVAGDFWEPAPSSCPSGPASILHIHGLADETFPTSGRAVAEHAHQGNLWQGWALWLRTDGCTSQPDRVDVLGDMTCQTWDAHSCSSARQLALCLHHGGHVFDAEWLREAYAWIAALDLAGAAHPPEASAPNARGPR